MDLTRFGMGLKRWLAFGILGFLLILLGITEILDNRFFSNLYKLYFFFLIGSGVFIVYISISEALKRGGFDDVRLLEQYYRKHVSSLWQP